MLAEFMAAHWKAEVAISDGGSPDGFTHVECRTTGDSVPHALMGAEYILNAFCKGRLAFIRVKPEAASDTDFRSSKIVNKGYVRFGYKLEPGEWHYPDPNITIPFIGEALDGRS